MNKSEEKIKGTRLLILSGLMAAGAIILAAVENAFPPIFAAVPGVKLGLSNIAVMYALFFLGKKWAYSIAVIKSLFVFLTRGMIAGALSITGGIVSITVMALFIFIFRDRVSYLVLSTAGAIFHNLGQLAMVSVLLTNIYIWVYLPVLLVSGVLAGIATAALLKAVMPLLGKISKGPEYDETEK